MTEPLLPTIFLDDEEIARAARKVLERHSGTIYLSRLGQDLRAEFGAAFKIALGGRTLGDFVCEHLSDTYEIWGKGPYKRVGPHGSAETDVSPQPRLKYLDPVWHAFSSPLTDGVRRWIELGPPLKRFDTKVAPSDSAIEVSSEFIVRESPVPRERARAIAASIKRWANLHGIPSDQLEDLSASSPVPAPTLRSCRAGGVSEGLDALQRMIAAIPEEERAQFQLPLNLLGRLLQNP